ncbi:MAG TPA: hypothetical protein VH702_21805 [Vicinamibacterales bacterium]
MRQIFLLSALWVVCLAAGGCSRQEPPPFKVIATLHEVMEGSVAPPAEVIWDSVSTIVDEKGIHEHFPQNDVEWEIVEHAAIALAETSNLLMMEGRAKDTGNWLKYSQQLAETSMQAAEAARAKNTEQILETGEKIYDVCTACHMQYIVENGQSQ